MSFWSTPETLGRRSGCWSLKREVYSSLTQPIRTNFVHAELLSRKLPIWIKHVTILKNNDLLLVVKDIHVLICRIKIKLNGHPLKIKIPNIEIDLAWFQFALLNFSCEPLPPHPPSFFFQCWINNGRQKVIYLFFSWAEYGQWWSGCTKTIWRKDIDHVLSIFNARQTNYP